ncbi:MAG: glycosyltransferase family 4 protein [Bacteroidetes bacterium]|nr:glycosyltransferase family 4 protein [Bacteroidota bacterium]
MKKIKIFVDAHVFDNSFQGTTTYLKGLYSALVKNENFEITLAAENTEKLKLFFTDERFRFIQLKTRSKYKRLALEIPKLLKEHKFDYAHFQYITPLVKVRNCKYINTIHDLLFLDFPQYFPFSYRFTKKQLFKFSARKSDIICTVSDYSKNALIRHFHISPENIVITPNAVVIYNESYVNVKAKYNLDKYILFVSRVEPRKNHYLLLKTFVEMELYKQGYQLIFIGRKNDVTSENYFNYYHALPDEIKKRVLHFENISHDDLYGFYRYADLFVYPSLAEGFGIPPLEAAMAGCKVICSNQTAMSDFDFFGNYLFNPNNENELKEKIEMVLNDKLYNFNYIKQAIEKKYNWEIIAKNFAVRLQ